MDALRVEHYIGRATDFYRGLELLEGQEDYRYSSALLAIHAAISYSDALRSALGDDRLHDEDHRAAIYSLKALLASRRIEDHTGFVQFEYLISMKSYIAYGDKRLDENRCMRIVLAAQRFAGWTSKVARRLKMEGWHHGE
jgi:hypothetical protein